MQCVAHGADTIVFFRWRSCAMGTEQYWHGLLPHNGVPGRYFREVEGFMKQYAPLLREMRGALPQAEVAILRSYDQEYAFQIQPHHPQHSYIQHLAAYYKALHRANVPVDFVGEHHDWSGYKVLIAPLQFLMTPEHAAKLRTYVAQGGHLLLSWRSGVKDATNLCHTEGAVPCLVDDLCGLQLAEDDCLRDATGIVCWDGMEYECQHWCAIVQLTTAEVLASYGHDFYAGTPAVTRNTYGLGLTYYAGTTPGAELADCIVAKLLADAGIAALADTPHGVEVVRRVKDGCTWLFLLNHNAQTETVRMPEGFTPWDDMPWDGMLQPYSARVFIRR